MNHFWYLLLSFIHIANAFALAVVKTIIDQIVAAPILNSCTLMFCSLMEVFNGLSVLIVLVLQESACYCLE